MGAFGTGIFHDDSSLDWIEEDYSEGGVAAVREALLRVSEMPSDDYLEFDDAVAARASSGGDLTAHATERASARASSGADIRLQGRADLVDVLARDMNRIMNYACGNASERPSCHGEQIVIKRTLIALVLDED